MSRHFASERDTWLIVLAVSAMVISVAALIPILMIDIAKVIKVVMVGMQILTFVLVFWVCFGTFYVVDATELRIRSGPFRWRIPIAEIHRVSPTRSPWSSPTLSLNRLRIDYGKGKWILVSPERRAEFMHGLGFIVT